MLRAENRACCERRERNGAVGSSNGFPDHARRPAPADRSVSRRLLDDRVPRRRSAARLSVGPRLRRPAAPTSAPARRRRAPSPARRRARRRRGAVAAAPGPRPTATPARPET